MTRLCAATLALLALILSGCATSIGTYEQRSISEGEAVVLVGIDSEIPLSEARYCSGICTAWYKLGGRRDVMAFPTSVGSTFQLNSIHTLDMRVAPLRGQELKIDRRGIYFYGTIVGTFSRAGIRTAPHPRLLLAAKRKYGTRFDGLEAINFTWPDPANDRYLGIGYQSAASVQAALLTHAGRHLQLAKVAPPEQFDATCRGGGPISLPDFLPYEEYIRRAFNQELQAAKLYDDQPGSVVLTGALTELAFSTTGDYHWKAGVRIQGPNGRSIAANVNIPFNGSWAAAAACTAAEDAVPSMVQKLIEAVVASPDFLALLSETAGSTASR